MITQALNWYREEEAMGCARLVRRRARAIYWGVALVIAASVSGCQLTVKQYPGVLTAQQDRSRAVEGVSVVADPLRSVNDQEAYLGANMSDAGILPIYISVTNNNQHKSFIVDANTITVNSGGQLGATGVGTDVNANRQTTGSALTYGGTIAALMPVAGFAVAVAGSVVSINANISAEAVDMNMFVSGTLSPGGKLAGFYYADARQIRDGAPNTICVQVLDPLTDASLPCCVSIESKG
jgi:hypothetical protein